MQDLQNRTDTEATEGDNPRELTPSTQGEQSKKKVKIPDLPIFRNDGNGNWYVDMKVKLRSESSRDEDDKMGYILHSLKNRQKLRRL